MTVRCLLALATVAWTLPPALVHADERAVVVVNAVPGDEARAAAAPRVTGLRHYLVDRGLARALPAAVAAAVEGTGGPGDTLDLSAARRAYAQFDYARAHALLEAHTADVLALASPDALPHLVAELLLWRGVIAVAESDVDAALQWFRGAQRLWPERELARADFSPRIRRVYARARAPVSGDSGTLRVQIEPADATVAIDDVPPTARRGRRVEPGVHLVVARRAGHAPRARLVTVGPGQTQRLRWTLPPQTRAMAAARATAALASARTAPSVPQLRPLSRVVDARWLLIVAPDDAGGLRARLYDARTGKRSRSISLPTERAPRAVAAMVQTGALDLRLPRTVDERDLVGGPTPARDDDSGGASARWYQRWWIWAAVGAVTVGATSAYVVTRADEPRLKGFASP